MYFGHFTINRALNPSNAELNPICHLLALLGAHRILHVSRIRVNFLFCRFSITKGIDRKVISISAMD